jgi:hypothetical protein
MNSYTMHHVGMARQHDRLASADRARQAKADRPASRATGTAVHTTDIPARPWAWLREMVGSFTTHLTFHTGAHQGSR